MFEIHCAKAFSYTEYTLYMCVDWIPSLRFYLKFSILMQPKTSTHLHPYTESKKKTIRTIIVQLYFGVLYIICV